MSSPYINVNGMQDNVREIRIRGPRNFFVISLGPYINVSDYDHQPDHDQFNMTIGQSFLDSAAAFRAVPAAKYAVEALEKVTYDGISNGDDHDHDHEDDDADESKLTIKTCVICMEEVMVGSHLTRMPCSHLFHDDCILQWLRRNHTCPLCRFKLPIN